MNFKDILPKLFIYLIGFLLTSAAIITGISFLIPPQKHVETNIAIDAPIEFVRPYLDTLRHFNRWQPWADANTNTRYWYTGPDSGLNAKMHWSNPNPEIGSASQEIVAISGSRIDIDIYDSTGETAFSTYFLLEENANETRIAWGRNENIGNNPINKLLLANVEVRWETGFNVGLANLKKVVEKEYQVKLEREKEKFAIQQEQNLEESESESNETEDVATKADDEDLADT